MQAAAKEITASVSKLSRLERADSPPDLRDVKALARFYRVDSQEEQRLLLLAQRATAPEWFQRYSDCTASWMRRLIGLEAQCAVLWTFEMKIVPGLLQTDDYARQIIVDGLPEAGKDPEAVEQRTELRRERQRRFFEQSEPPQATFLLDESILYRQVGSRAVTRAQIQKLEGLLENPRVSIRIVPFHGSVVSNYGSMTHLAFEEDGLPPLVYIEGNDEATYHTTSKDVERHIEMMLRLSNESAASREDSRIMLRKAIERLSG
jgi:hypothetical protein